MLFQDLAMVLEIGARIGEALIEPSWGKNKQQFFAGRATLAWNPVTALSDDFDLLFV